MEDVPLVCRNVRSYICDCFAKLSLFGRGEGRKANPLGGGGGTTKHQTG